MTADTDADTDNQFFSHADTDADTDIEKNKRHRQIADMRVHGTLIVGTTVSIIIRRGMIFDLL